MQNTHNSIVGTRKLRGYKSSPSQALTQWSVHHANNTWYILPTSEHELGLIDWQGPFSSLDDALSEIKRRLSKEASVWMSNF